MKRILLATVLASQLAACGTTNNYYVVNALTPADFPKPASELAFEPATPSAQVEADDWDVDKQLTAMFYVLGCSSFGRGEYEPVCLETRKLIQACSDYEQSSGIGSGKDARFDKTCSNIFIVDWVRVLAHSKT